jgi:hypothetical protein
MPWIDAVAPGRPFGLRLEGKTLTWEVPEAGEEMDRSRFFAIYRYKSGENTRAKRVENLVQVTGETRFTFEQRIPTGIYRVSGLDRLHNESQLSDPLLVK